MQYLKTFLLYSLAWAVIQWVSILQYLSYSIFYRSLNASCTLAFLLFLYCALDRSISYISIPKIVVAILLSLSCLVGYISGFILGQSQWAIIVYIVLYFFLIYSFIGSFYILFIQAIVSSFKYIQSGRNPILYSSTAFSVNLYAPIIVQKYRFCAMSS